MQLGWALGSNLGLFWTPFWWLLSLASRSYLEVVLALIFYRFRTPLEDRKPSFRIVNNMVSYTSAFLTWTPFLDRSWTPKVTPKSSPRGSKTRSETKSKIYTTSKWILNATWPQHGPKLAPKKLLFRRVGGYWWVSSWHLLPITTSNPGDPVQESILDRILYRFLIDFWSIFSRCLIDFCSMFVRFWIDGGMIFGPHCL